MGYAISTKEIIDDIKKGDFVKMPIEPLSLTEFFRLYYNTLKRGRK